MAKAQAFDAAEYLDNPEAIAAYLSEAFETGDGRLIAQALGTVARVKSMKSVAKDAGVVRLLEIGGLSFLLLMEKGTRN